jgi:hypothetical protein
MQPSKPRATRRAAKAEADLALATARQAAAQAQFGQATHQAADK